MQKILLLFASFLLLSNLYSQPLAAYHDYRQHFVIFDNGVTKSIENLPVESYQIGKKCIPYVSNSGQFKV